MDLIKEPLARGRQIQLGIAGVALVLLVGEGAARSGLVGEGLPVPSALLVDAARLLTDAEFLSQVWFTVREWLLGLLIATVAGALIGGLMGAIPVVHRMLEIPVEILRPLPSVAVGPLLVLILGSGMLPLSLTVAVACVWPILFNALHGVRATDPVAVQTARTLHVGPWGILTRIRLPSALPFVFTGVRVAASIGLIVAVSAELLIGASGAGIGGYILLMSTTAADLDAVYAATAIAGVLGVLISGLFALIDRTAFGWKKGLAQ